MILHKYIEPQYLIPTLEKGRLKVSLPTELNDPFEFLPKLEMDPLTNIKDDDILNSPLIEIFYSKVKSKLSRTEFNKILLANKNAIRIDQSEIRNLLEESQKYDDHIIRFVSFSSDKVTDDKQILLWSHYSASHKGVRLHFKPECFPDNVKLKKINYQKTRTPLKFNFLDDPVDMLSQEELEKILITKLDIWKYEAEFRMFIFPEFCYKEDNLNFWNFEPKSLVRIDLGIRYNDVRVEDILSTLFKNNLEHVKLYKTNIHLDEYKLEYVKLK